MELGYSNKETIEELLTTYKGDVDRLARFLPWLEQMSGKNLDAYQTPEGSGPHALQVPVYDSNLLAFIKEAQKTGLMRRNYVYTFSRKRITSVRDELRVIEQADILDIAVIGDVMAKYILGGQSKSILWNQGVYNGVYLAGVRKMKELVEYWTVPRQGR
ncbi:MAG: hypothetical protein MJ105_02115 [Lachnospiraceae bacterium]|nr:hypothetical protein [Lachnospiraceae bacterium]